MLNLQNEIPFYIKYFVDIMKIKGKCSLYKAFAYIYKVLTKPWMKIYIPNHKNDRLSRNFNAWKQNLQKKKRILYHLISEYFKTFG